ncbi:MAG: alginate export family protein [Phycisphaerae bacterium]
MNGSFSKRFQVAVVAATLVALAGAQSYAQVAGETTGESLLQQQRLIDEQLDRQRKELAPLDALLDWQWGGWLEYYIFHFDDGIQSQRVFQRPGLSLWTRLSMDGGAHEIFARMRLTFEYFSPGDQYDRRQDWVGPNLDRGWYQIDVGRAFRLTDPADPYQMRIRVGRQEVRFGTGYTLDLPLDAVTFDAKLHDFRVVGLFAKTIASYPNIDRSEPVDTHSARRFFGVEVNYEGIENHRPFVYALWNDDFTDERPKDPLQNYSYDTQYFGAGARGSLAHNLNYWTEWVYETGDSYGDGNFLRRDDVDAWAWDVGVEYLWDVATRPRVSFEYMFASGDAGRLFSPTSASGGNRGDRDDSSFVGFGYRDTGIAAAPSRSNIHIWRLGGGLAPLEKIELCRDLEIGTNWFLYHKHHRRGAISDPTAGDFEGYIGWEMDYFLNWRLASDLSWTLRWGAFFPGDAFQDRSMRNFLFTGMTWSF